MRVALLYNPDAGEDDQPSGDELVELIRRGGHTVVCHLSHDENLETALAEPADIIAVAGGDGTVGRVAKTMIGKSIPIAVLPMGTANNIATSLGIVDRPLEELIAEWASARRVKFDVAEAKGPWGSKYFLEGFGVGLFSETMSRLHSKHHTNLAHLDDAEIKITSVLHILKERLRNYVPKKLQLNLDGQDLSGEYILVEVLNIKHIGPNLHLAPEADPSDGLLDVVLVRPTEQDDLSKYFSDAPKNKSSTPELPVNRGSRLKIAWDGFLVHIDDESWPAPNSDLPLSLESIEVKAEGQKLEFLAPG